MLTRSWKLFGIAIIIAGLVQFGCNGDDPDPDFGGPDTGIEDDSEVPDPDSEVPDPDSEVPDPDSEVPDPDSEIPDPDGEVPDPDGEVPDPDGEVGPDSCCVIDGPIGPLPEWTLEPAEGAAFEGDYNEEFDPNSAEYDLTNDGTADLNFETILTEPWLSVDPASGTIAPGDTLTVTITVLGEEGMKAAMGDHTTTVTFEFNGMESETDTRTIDLTVYNPGDRGWLQNPANPVFAFGDPATEWDAAKIYPSVLQMADGSYMMWYVGLGSEESPAIGHGTSPTGEVWTFEADPVLTATGDPADFDAAAVYMPTVVFDDATAIYHMFYVGQNADEDVAFGHATSLDGIAWEKSDANPVVESAGKGVEAPAVILDGGVFKMWYIDDEPGGAQLKLSTSPGGDVWTEDAANPLHTFTEPNWPTALAVWKDGTDSIYRLWYTMSTEEEDEGEMKDVEMGIFYASSPDGVTWELSENKDDAVIEASENGEWNTALEGLSVWREDTGHMMMTLGACAKEEEEGCATGVYNNDPPGMISGTLSADPSVTCGTDPENDCIGTVLVAANSCPDIMCPGGGFMNFSMTQNVDLSNAQTFDYLVEGVPPTNAFVSAFFWESNIPAVDIGVDSFPPPLKEGDMKLMVPLEVAVISNDTISGQNGALDRLVPGPFSVHGTVFVDPSIPCDPGNPDEDCVGDLVVLIADPGEGEPFAFYMEQNIDVSTDPAPYILFDLPAGDFIMMALIMDAGGQLGGPDFPPPGSLVSNLMGGGDPVTIDPAGPAEVDIPLVIRWAN